MRTIHSPKENRLLYRLVVTAPNVQISKTPNSAYLDTLFDLIYYYTISFTHLFKSNLGPSNSVTTWFNADKCPKCPKWVFSTKIWPPAGRSKCRHVNLSNLSYYAYVTNFNRIRPLMAEIFTFEVLKLQFFRVKLGLFRDPVDKIWRQTTDMDYSVPKEEPAAVNRLDFTTPNVRTAKPLNSAYLSPGRCFSTYSTLTQ